MKAVFALLIVLSVVSVSKAQEIGTIRVVQLLLEDLPISGDAIQANFSHLDSNEEFSFNHMDWLDKHVSLYEFYHLYRDSCRTVQLVFEVTLIYIPLEQYNYVRYEGYLPTGDISNQWVLTSCVKMEEVFPE